MHYEHWNAREIREEAERQERAHTAASQAIKNNMGRRQAAFARAGELLAGTEFGSPGEKVQAQVFVAEFLLGDA